MQRPEQEFTGIAGRELTRTIRSWYADAPLVPRTMQSLRPYICPFAVLLEEVPPGSRILDIGCGAGLFIALLARAGRISEAVGFDVNSASIQIAQQMLSRLGTDRSGAIRFVAGKPGDELPTGTFDVVSMIDVLHHVPVAMQEAAIRMAAARVAPGGIFLYKDIGARPLWRGTANRLHDLLVSHEWIHYCPIDRVTAWAQDSGLRLRRSASNYLFWYHHELRCFSRD